MQITKRIIAVVMTILMLVSIVPANVFALDASDPMSLDKEEYVVGEAIIPKLYEASSYGSAWIGVYFADDPVDGSEKSFWWINASDVTAASDFAHPGSGFKANYDKQGGYAKGYVDGEILPGEYKLVYYVDDGYSAVKSEYFSVVNNAPTVENSFVMNKTEFCVGEPINFTATSSDRTAWIGLYKKSVTSYPDNSISWCSVYKISGVETNVLEYLSPLEKGEYKLVFFQDGGYDNLLNDCEYEFSVNDHNYSNNLVVSKKATFTENGVINGTCACGATGYNSDIVKASATLEYSSVMSDGRKKEPVVTVVGKDISADDYTVEYANNVEAGDATATVKLNNDYYEDEIVLSFKITASEHVCDFSVPFVEPATFEKDGRKGFKCDPESCGKIDDESIVIIPAVSAELSEDTFDFNGSAVEAEVVVFSGETELVNGEDYTVSYTNNEKPGKENAATVTVELCGDDYSGSKVLNFTINAMSVKKTTFCIGEDINVKAYKISSDKDWVGIFKTDGVPSESFNSYFWYYVTNNDKGIDNNGVEFRLQNGDVNTDTPSDRVLEEGTYYIYFLLGDGYEIAQSIEINVVDHEAEVVTGTPADCYNTGLTDGEKCKNCGKILVEQEEIAITHGETEVIDAIAPTCTEVGYTEGAKCSVCGVVTVEPEEVPENGHTEIEIPAIPATCKVDGYTSGLKCGICGTITVEPEFVPAAHTEIVPIGEAKLPTCTEDGITAGEKCNACGDIITEQEVIISNGHSEEILPAKAATCTETGLTEGKKCSVCKTVTVEQKVTPVVPHTEEVLPAKAATCTETGLTAGKKCTVCNTVTEEQEVTPVVPHTEEVLSAKAATCTETGLTEGKKCSVCNNVIVAQKVTDLIAHTEVIIPGVEATCSAAGLTAGKMCSVCKTITVEQSETAKLPHLDVTISGKDATCTETGLTAGSVCKTCNTVLTEQKEIPALGHNELVDDGKAATCTQDGYTAKTVCTRCDKVLVANEIIPAFGHKEVVVPGYAATCDEIGYTDGKQCSVCGEVTLKQNKISATGHNYITVPGKAATCTETGLTDGRKCSLCGNVEIEHSVIAAFGHDSVLDLGKEPTCTEKGLTDGRKCSVCGTVTEEKKVVDALGHKEITLVGKDATCTSNGLTDGKKCTVCGVVTVEQKDIPALGHKEVVLEGKSATCTEPGITEGKKCDDCGLILVEQKEIAATGHKAVKIEAKNATCTATGLTEGEKCSVCGKITTAQKETSALGHKEVAIPAKKATYKATGLTEGKKCSVCGKVTVKQKKVSRKKLSKVKSLKVKSTTTTTVKLSWKKVTGAEIYTVYYSTNGKKWKSVKATKNSVTLKKLSSGKNYQFKVKAVAGKYSGSTSSVVKTATKVAKVTVSSVKSTKKAQATVNWKTVSGADGYVVEYSTSKKFTKKTTKTATVKKGSSKKTTLKKLKSGKKYYVRVKAYKTVNDKAVYGSVSSTKTVTVK